MKRRVKDTKRHAEDTFARALGRRLEDSCSGGAPMGSRRCEESSGIASVHELYGHILPFLGEQVCVAAAVCKEWAAAVSGLSEQFWKLTALKQWPGMADMDALTHYASYRDL